MGSYILTSMDSSTNPNVAYSDYACLCVGSSQTVVIFEAYSFPGWVTRIIGKENIWKVNLMPGQQILTGVGNTSIGGSVTATKNTDAVEITCIIPNQLFIMYILSGNPILA